MRISEFLCNEAINLNVASKDKKGVIAELVELLGKNGKVKDASKAIFTVMEREKLGTTGVGQGVAIPHGRTDTVNKLVGAFGISRNGVQFDSLDGEPVYLIFLLLSPSNNTGPHLRALARISRIFKDKYFKKALLEATSKEQIVNIIDQEDEY